MTLQLYLKLFGMSYCYIIHNVLLSNVAVTVVRNLVSLYSWKWTVSVYSSADNGASGAAFQLGKAQIRGQSRETGWFGHKAEKREDTGKQGAAGQKPLLVMNISHGDVKAGATGSAPGTHTPICHFLSWLSSLCLSSPTFDLAWFIMISNGPFFFLCCSSATCAPECLL